MNTEDHIIDGGGQREIVEHLVGLLPEHDGDVLGETLFELAEKTTVSIELITSL